MLHVAVRRLALAALGVTVLVVGLYFAWLRGALILPVGLAGILILLLFVYGIPATAVRYCLFTVTISLTIAAGYRRAH